MSNKIVYVHPTAYMLWTYFNMRLQKLMIKKKSLVVVEHVNGEQKDTVA